MNTLWIHYECIRNTLWLHYEYIMNTLWINYEYIRNTLWIHYEYITKKCPSIFYRVTLNILRSRIALSILIPNELSTYLVAQTTSNRLPAITWRHETVSRQQPHIQTHTHSQRHLVYCRASMISHKELTKPNFLTNYP